MANPIVVTSGSCTSINGGANQNFTVPNTAQVNDIIVYFGATYGTSGLGAPSGGAGGTWTLVTNASAFSSSVSVVVYVKAVQSGDIGAVMQGGTGTGTTSGGCWALLRGVNPSSLVDVSGSNTSATSLVGSESSPALTTTTDNDLILDFWFWSANCAITTPAAAVGSNYQSGGGGTVAISSRTQTTHGSLASDTATSNASSHAGVSTVTFKLMAAPLAPTCNSPANASYQDLSGTSTFSWTPNPSPGNGSQNAYAFRQKVSGAGSYNYWNASTSSWQSTIVWNSSATASLTFPAAAWTNGNIYNWSVATQESVDNLQGPFASDFTVTAQTPPVVTVTAPSGTIANFTPTVTWTVTLAAGATQTSYRVVVYSAAQYGAQGFTPGTSTGVADSGTINTADTSWTIPQGDLTNNTTYRAYVQVSETGGETSAWSYTSWTISVDTPAPPVVTATVGTDPSTGLPLVNLTVQSTDNLLSVDDASFESGVGSWVAGTNWNAPVQDATKQVDGSYSLKCVRANTTAGNGYASVGHYAVAPNTTYTALASVLGDATTNGKPFALIVQGNTTPRVEVDFTTTEAWQPVSAQITTAADETDLWFFIADDPQTAPTSGQTIWLDKTGIRPGTDTGWYRGGLVGAVSVVVQSSDDDGEAWTSVRGGDALELPADTQQVLLTDRESVPGTQRLYRSQASVVVSDATLISPWSVNAGVTVTTSDWWLVVPTNTGLSTAIVVSSFTTPILERVGSHYGLGSPYPTVVDDVVGGIDGSMTVETFTPAALDALIAIIRNQRTVWLTSPTGFPAQYVRLGLQPGQGSGSAGGVTVLSADLDKSVPYHRTVTLTFVQVTRP